MKKIFAFLIGTFFLCGAHAGLVLNNTTCATIYVTVICHDGTYSACGALESSTITIPPYTSLSYSNTSMLGTCTIITGGSGTHTPTGGQGWDGAKFGASDGVTTPPLGATVDKCGGSTFYDSGTGAICGTSQFEALISTSGSTTTILFCFC